MPARIDDLLVLNANLSKTDFAKYLRDREAVLPSDFGGLGDRVADDRAAIQAAFDRAAADGKMAVIPPSTWNVSAGVTLGGGARGLIMRGVLRYTGTAPATVLTFGDGGTIRNGEKLYANLQVVRQTQSDWLSEADTASWPATWMPACSMSAWSRASPSACAPSATAAASRTARSICTAS